MANPLDSIKKLRLETWSEIRARGKQAVSGYSDRIGLSGKLPTDEEFIDLLNHKVLGERLTRENLLTSFSASAKKTFFSSFSNRLRTIELFQQLFPDEADAITEKADGIVDERFDLLGYTYLDFGSPVDWHYEPIAKKHSPMRHWKQFDELATDETGDKRIIWELNRHQHFFTLGVAYLLTGKEIYAETFVKHLKSWMERNPPGIGVNWLSSLEVSFRAISWLWAFRFFENSKALTPKVFHRALKYLLLHGRHLEKYLSTYFSPNTHLTGEALGLYYLGTQLPFFDRAGEWRKIGRQTLLAELDRQILEDGVYFEQSTAYHRYSADIYLQFLVLADLNSEKLESPAHEKLRSKLQKMLDFSMYMTRPDGTTPLIGDDDGGRCLPLSNRAPNDFRSLLSTGALLLERGEYKFVSQEFAPETLWLLGPEAKRKYSALAVKRPKELSRAFHSGGYFVMRDGWQETDNFLVVDCGELGALSAGHAHADALSIDLTAGGRNLIVDPGTYTYHESRELREHFRATKSHNTLTVNGRSSSETSGKFSWKSRANAREDAWISDERFDFFEGQHDGYSEMLKPCIHMRSILSLRNDYWIIRDYVETNARNQYELNFQFDPDAKPAVRSALAGKEFVEDSLKDGVGLRMFTFGDGGKWTITPSFVSRCYGRRESASCARFVSKGIGSQEFFTFLIPTDRFNQKPGVIETTIPGGRAFVVNFRDYNDIFMFSDGDDVLRTEFFSSNFRFAWARLSAAEELPEEFVLIRGNTLVVGEREVISSPAKVSFLSARRLGNRLNVKTNEGVFSVNLPKNRPAAYVLKDNERF